MIETVNKLAYDRVKGERNTLVRDLTSHKRALAVAHEEIARFLKAEKKA